MKKSLFLLVSLSSLLLGTSCSSDDNNNTTPILQPSDGAVLQPLVGGSTQPNQVFVDLSTESSQQVNRGSWDLGFYSGSSFRVVINSSVQMAVKKLTTTDITQAVEEDLAVAVGTFDPQNVVFIDEPSGNIAQTAIAEVSDNDAENFVYLVNLGTQIPNIPAATGAINTAGASRGWKKIRVLKSGNQYKLQFADLNASQFTEVNISKNPDYHFTFFSMISNAVVQVEPKKTEWDLNFTTFTNIIPNAGSYFYSDIILTNSRGGTLAYQVLNSEGVTYDSFTKTMVDESLFSNDQRAIGANWRNGGGPNSLPNVRDDRFFVLKDVTGNYYKIQFISMTNSSGERGNPTFQYAILN
jgi:hypothetical protein